MLPFEAVLQLVAVVLAVAVISGLLETVAVTVVLQPFESTTENVYKPAARFKNPGLL